MRPAVILLILSSQLGIGLGYPQGVSGNRVGIKRPSRETPPQMSECELDNFLSGQFGISGNSNCKSGVGNNPPTSPQPVDPQPVDPQPVDPQPNNQTGPDGCDCTPFYLCNDNNTIIVDGTGIIDIRIKDDCGVLQKCCGSKKVLPIDPSPTSKPRPSGGSTCGNRNSEGIAFRITGNTDNEAQYGEFPWVVAVIRPNTTAIQLGMPPNVYQCGGSLIHPQVVLTGAHCVRGKDNLFIRAGEWDTQTKVEPHPTQDRKVSEVIVHEQFNIGSLANDPALLILESPIDMSIENVGLICLPEPNENMDGRNCVASGWGKDLFGKKGKYSVMLKRVDLPMVPRNQCQQALGKTRLGPRFKLHDSFVCAGGQLGKDTCKGDGGGPLVCPSLNNSRVYVQAGIVAWGIGCSTEAPGVYVNVPYFVNWINDKMKTRNIV